MNPFEAANAISNPGQYAQAPVYGEEDGTTESPLSAGGVAPNALNNLGGLAELLGGNKMSSSQDFSSGLGSVDFSNPYAGQSGPVASRQVVDYGSQPVLNPVNNTYKAPSPTAPNMGVTGGQEFDYFENYVGNNVEQYNPFSPTYESSPQAQQGMFSSTPEGRTDLGFGMSFNADAISNNFNPSYAGSWKDKGQSIFDFGDTSLAKGLGGEGLLGASKYAAGKLGQFGRATGDYDLYGKASELNAINNMFGMTGNRAWDMGTKGTLLEYANDPLTPRSMLGAAVNKAGFGYGGLTMTGLDYLQGYNPDTGSLYRSGAYALNPVAGGLGDLFGVWDKVGTKAGSFTADPTKANTLDELNKGYYSKFTDGFGNAPGDAAVADYLGGKGMEVGTHQYDMAVNAYNMAMDEKNPYGQGFRDSMAQGRAETAAYEALDAQVAETKKQEAAAEAQRVAQAKAEAEKAAMIANNQFSSSDSGSFDAGGNYSDWGSQAEYEDDQGDSSWSSSDSGGGDSGGGGGGSYIATAATQALGEEGLTIFEEWRDYMFTKLPTFTTSYGRYRVTAPKIVAEIDKRDNSKQLYSWVWDMHLKPIFNLIKEDKDSEKALRDYKTMVKELQVRFLKEKA